MSWLLLHHGALASLYAGRSHVPAAEAASLADAMVLLAHAEAIAADAAACAEHARIAAAARGHAEGHAAGEASLRDEFAQSAARHAADTHAAIATLRAEATELALAVVRHIAGELAPDTMLAGLAVTALDRLGPGAVTLRVAPSAVDALQRCLASRPATRVLADPTLGGLDLVIDTDSGRAHAGLDAQLALVAEHWRADAA